MRCAVSREPDDHLDAELSHFISSAREVFRGESWDQAQSYLERVWFNSGLCEVAAWADIESRVRSGWDAKVPETDVVAPVHGDRVK